jgi:hypothetical protein
MELFRSQFWPWFVAEMEATDDESKPLSNKILFAMLVYYSLNSAQHKNRHCLVSDLSVISDPIFKCIFGFDHCPGVRRSRKGEVAQSLLPCNSVVASATAAQADDCVCKEQLETQMQIANSPKRT